MQDIPNEAHTIHAIDACDWRMIVSAVRSLRTTCGLLFSAGP